MRHDIRKTDRVYGEVKRLVIEFASRNRSVKAPDLVPPLKLDQATRNLHHFATNGLLRRVRRGTPGRGGVTAEFVMKRK